MWLRFVAVVLAGAWNDPEILQEIEDEFRMDQEDLHREGSRTPPTAATQTSLKGLASVNGEGLPKNPASISSLKRTV
eukprot:scaffold118341_cov16-Prasinocladus_malaysianus.AAC.1